VKRLDKLLKRGAVSESDLRHEDRGDTALAWALRSGAHDVAARLLRLAWRWQWRDALGRDYLALALHVNARAVASQLIALRAAHPSAWGPHSDGSESALHVAARRGLLDALQELLVARVCAVDARGPHQQTALHTCAASGDRAAVELLLAHGAALDAVDAWGETPLLLAAREGRVECLKLLVARGSDVTVTNRDGLNALMALIRSSAAKTAVLLEGVDLLLDAGVDVNARDAKGWSALHLAAMLTNPGLVIRLLEHWARPDARDEASGATPLHVAARKGDMATVQALLAAGADIDAEETHSGETALRIAVRDGREALVRYLLESGACHARTLLRDPSLIATASSRIREMLELSEDGSDTSDLLLMPRESVFDAPQIRAATVEQLVIRATHEKHTGPFSFYRLVHSYALTLLA